MMKDVISKNGVLLNGVRTWYELTSNEQATVIFPAGESKADYKNYQVRHNGKVNCWTSKFTNLVTKSQKKSNQQTINGT